MNDNNEELQKSESDISSVLEKKDYCMLLRELALEYEEKLYSINMQIKTQNNLIKEKENEVAERERTKAHNQDLFSPFYNKPVEDSNLVTVIDNIRNTLLQLEKEQKVYIDKIEGLRAAANYIEKINYNEDDEDDQNSTDVIDESRYNYNDKGLSILEAQEIERQRIARDLHDSTVQNLTSLVHKSELCIKLIDIDSTRAKLELTSMSSTIKSVINEMRGIIYNLKPMSLDDLGLNITIERFASRLMDLNNINVIVHSNEEAKEILPVIKLTLFRIIQEACNNVIKHANASLINIDIVYSENSVTVSVKDNGVGFIINQPAQSEGVKHSSSFGLSIMKERISLLSGTVDIKSEKGMGTTVIVSVPLTIFEGDTNE